MRVGTKPHAQARAQMTRGPRTLIWRLLPLSWPKMAERRWRRLNGYSRGEGGRGLLRHRGSPTELVIDARADEVFGERH